jgi:hypothetical protein
VYGDTPPVPAIERFPVEAPLQSTFVIVMEEIEIAVDGSVTVMLTE